MTIHPKIKHFISLLKEHGISDAEIKNKISDALKILKESKTTSTEAIVVFHQGFGFPDIEAEAIVKSSKLWDPEAIQDIAYQTFLYLNYNPEDPNFFYDDNKVRFPLFRKKKENED